MPSEQQMTNEMHASKLFLSLLGMCAIVASTPTTVLGKPSFNRELAPVSQQHSLSEKKANNKSARTAAAVLEELDLEREWEWILGDKSGLEFLGFANSHV